MRICIGLFLLAMGVFLSSSPLAGSEVDPVILEKAFDVTATANFSAEMIRTLPDKKRFCFRFFQLSAKENNGLFIYRRRDTISLKDLGKESYIALQSNLWNRKGGFIHIGKVAFKQQREESLNWLPQVISAKEFSNIVRIAAQRESTYNGVDCLEFTLELNNGRKLIIAVGKSDMLIYFWSESEGEKLQTQYELHRVVIDEKIEPAFFEVPPEVKIFNTTDEEEMIQILRRSETS